jgi:hypothetical protein
MAATVNARAMAARVNAALRKAGSPKQVDAKRVRAWVRDNVAAYDDDGYTAHAYDARTAATIERGMVASRVAAKGATAQGRARRGRVRGPHALQGAQGHAQGAHAQGDPF